MTVANRSRDRLETFQEYGIQGLRQRQAVSSISRDVVAAQPLLVPVARVGACIACTRCHGHILFTSGPHGCYQSQQKPTRTVRQEVSAEHEQHTQGRATDIVGTLAGIPGLACIVCIIPACSRGPLDVIAISSSGSSLHRSTSVRVCSRSRASCCRLHHVHKTAFCAAEILLSRKNQRPGFVAGVMTVKSSRLFNLALPARKAFILADALQRAAFAVPSKW